MNDLSCGRTLECAPEPTKHGPEVVAHVYVIDGEVEDWGWGDTPLLPKDPSLVRLIRLSDYEALRSVVTDEMIEAGAKAFLKAYSDKAFRSAYRDLTEYWSDYKKEIKAAIEAALEVRP